MSIVTRQAEKYLHVLGETLHTMPLCHSMLAFVHMCVRRLHGGFLYRLFTKTQRRVRCWWLACVARVSPACTMTEEFTLRFHRALPSTAALLTRAQRFNYWPVSTRNLISWATQEIASRSVKVVTGLLDSEGKCTHIVPVCIWLCCELLADYIMAGWKHMQAPLGTVWTKRSFW